MEPVTNSDEDDDIAVLQANDINTLLEQFEASEDIFRRPLFHRNRLNGPLINKGPILIPPKCKSKSHASKSFRESPEVKKLKRRQVPQLLKACDMTREEQDSLKILSVKEKQQFVELDHVYSKSSACIQFKDFKKHCQSKPFINMSTNLEENQNISDIDFSDDEKNFTNQPSNDAIFSLTHMLKQNCIFDSYLPDAVVEIEIAENEYNDEQNLHDEFFILPVKNVTNCNSQNEKFNLNESKVLKNDPFAQPTTPTNKVQEVQITNFEKECFPMQNKYAEYSIHKKRKNCLQSSPLSKRSCGKTKMCTRSEDPYSEVLHSIKMADKVKQWEDRRIVYVGKLGNNTSVSNLRKAFAKYGDIENINIHSRDNGDNYGFITYYVKENAYQVVASGHLDPELHQYDLCFGGRRQFCKARYSDLDSGELKNSGSSSKELDFDKLLKLAKEKSNKSHYSLSFSPDPEEYRN